MLGCSTAQPAERMTPSHVFQCRTFTKSLNINTDKCFININISLDSDDMKDYSRNDGGHS